MDAGCWPRRSDSAGAPTIRAPNRPRVENDFARALGIIDLGHRPTVREAGAAVFVRRRDDREVYDARVLCLLAPPGADAADGPQRSPSRLDAPREEGEPG